MDYQMLIVVISIASLISSHFLLLLYFIFPSFFKSGIEAYSYEVKKNLEEESSELEWWVCEVDRNKVLPSTWISRESKE